MSYVGTSVKRLEDRPLLTGNARFAADIELPGQIHMRVVRSPVAHGVLSNVDISSAAAIDGVVAVWKAADVVDVPPIDFRMTRVAGLEPYRQPVLADSRVRYVGEPIAVVFAETPYVAEDAAEQVDFEIDELPPVITARDEPGVFDQANTTEAALVEKAYGDIEAAFHEPHAIVELSLDVGRHSGIPLETRGALARFDKMSRRLQMYGVAKVPHYNRDAIASMLGMAKTDVFLSEAHVGGGFGIRGELYPEDVLVCLGATRIGRPVKWIEDRREHFLAANHSRDQHHVIKAAIDVDGWVRGVVDEFWLSQGAYVRTHAATVPDLTAALLPGPYVWPAYQVRGHVRLTNKTPAGTYRAPGRYEGTFVRERLMDVVDARLDLDPAQVRRRNLVGADTMPFVRGLDALGTDVIYDSGEYVKLLDRVLDFLDYENLRHEIELRRKQGAKVGIGLGYFVEKSGLGPFDGVRIVVDEAGRTVVHTGAASVGQGMETVMAQVVADTLGVSIESVEVRHGQTDDLPFGMGAFASRVTVMTGSAAHIAATRVREKSFKTAAVILEAGVEDLVIDRGRIYVKGSPQGPAIQLGEVAAALRPGPDVSDPGLSAEGWFKAVHMNYPYGLHAALVLIDPDTGGVSIERYVVAYDVGRAINPKLIEGQIVGAAAQGIGGALFEEFVYDDHAQPLATSFMDYLMPTSSEMPDVDVLLSEDAPSPLNPLGVKGAGEGGITAAGAAIANAIADALQNQEGVRSIPLSPAVIRSLLAVRV